MSTSGISISAAIVLFSWTCISAQSRCNVDQRIATEWNVEAMVRANDIIAGTKDRVSFRAEVILPVVFHIVYTGDQEYVSDLQIQSQLDILNRDFAFMSENASFIPDEFYPLGADANIRFCLATTDPDGNVVTGITRTETVINNIGTHQRPNGRYSVHYDGYGGKDPWDTNKYINIWVASMNGLLGSATLPGTAAYPEEDGIVIEPDYFSGIGTGAPSYPFDKGHTLTHEMGHYLGLYHIWGPGSGDCEDDDFIEDTPQQSGPYLECPRYPQYSCGSSDMFMNFMDFTSDRCLALFTLGQISRMQATLIALRPGLLENDTSCDPAIGGKPDVGKAVTYYDPVAGQIIIVIPGEQPLPKTVELYAMDGRLVRSESWIIGTTYWIDTDGLASAVYIVNLRAGDMSDAKQVVVSR